ncbi:divalent-cation tolerance protein CutA [Chitinimonas sp. BJYL2]|uniref:divalent-cation tolerance protein CutA n=1 Tax=Chitinimonas sp. BJYL2 TaxID=2976696 RepID=UPI0022B3413D|nr:divalent-cation tolerance protein CutA [Chitinimonas sp. BJYL2]
MSEQDSVLVVLCTAPDEGVAEQLAGALIERRLAACVNLLAPARSLYRWEGKLEHATEIPMLIKTTHRAYPALENAIRELHPYQLPELLVLPVTQGLPAYLDWVRAETGSAA